VTTTDLETAAASTVEEAAAAGAKLDELMMCGLAGCFARVEPRRQARKYVTGLISDLPRKNRWALAEQAGDATPDRMQRLLERAAWDAGEAMAAVRSFAVRYLGDLELSPGVRPKASRHETHLSIPYLSQVAGLCVAL
jgi:hypothetical protein